MNYIFKSSIHYLKESRDIILCCGGHDLFIVAW